MLYACLNEHVTFFEILLVIASVNCFTGILYKVSDSLCNQATIKHEYEICLANINVNINVTAVPGLGTVGQSTLPVFSDTYTNLRAKMIADGTTADDTAALLDEGIEVAQLPMPVARKGPVQ